jgi:hypothetical protein
MVIKVEGPITGGDDVTNPDYGKINPLTKKEDKRRFIPEDTSPKDPPTTFERPDFVETGG